MTGTGSPPSLRGIGARIGAALDARRDRRALEFARRDRGEPALTPSTSPSDGAREPVAHPTRRRAAMVGASAASLALLLLLFLGPGSFRVWSQQRSQTSQLDAKLTALDTANASLALRAKQLKNPQAITELARRDYGMVPKGSKAYAILPAPVPDLRPGGTWPFIELQSTGATSPAAKQEPSSTGP